MQVVMLTISSGHLLVPVRMVAQIIGASDLIPEAGKLPFIRHLVTWRDHKVPLLYSSELCGAPVGADQHFERSVVLWPLRGAGNTEMMALTSQRAPRMADITAKTLSAEQPEADDYVLGVVNVEDGLGIIPDLEKVSQILYG